MPNIGLCLSAILVSLHQSFILSFGHFGQELLSTPAGRRFEYEIPHRQVTNYIVQLDPNLVTEHILSAFIPLLCIQLSLAIGYALQTNLRRKRRFAIVTWLFPCLFLHIFYLLSFLFALLYWPEFSLLGIGTSSTSKEMFTEGWMFQFAALGWFNIFWLTLVIKSVFCPASLESSLD
ncbi:MAG: hypothetical protein AAF974_03270 [Cyanobacteria bacterium P01_E01_bin.34]